MKIVKQSMNSIHRLKLNVLSLFLSGMGGKHTNHGSPRLILLSQNHAFFVYI